jgi:hypothetical protein
MIPPHDFKQQPRWYYRVQKRIKYDIGVVTCGITSIPNFMNFRPAILWLLNAFKQIPNVKHWVVLDLVTLSWVKFG